MEDKTITLAMVNSGCFQALHVRSVTNLCHRKTAHQSPRGGIWQIFAMMVFGAESLDASCEKTKLDSKLDDQADIVEGECFECRDELGQIFFPSDANVA